MRKRVCLSFFFLLSSIAIATSNETSRTLVFFGDSITYGYGLAPDESYPSLIQKKVDANKLKYRVVNAGVSGDTSASGLNRLDWVLKGPVDVFVLALGGNDGLRGVPLKSTRSNLSAIINKIQKKYPTAKIVLAGFQMPPNYGIAYTKEFAEMYPQLAKSHRVALIPHLLEGVGGDPKFNLPDRIHPTAEGQKIIAENVWKTLRPLLLKPTK